MYGKIVAEIFLLDKRENEDIDAEITKNNSTNMKDERL